MNRIKDITKINLPTHSVLLKVYLKNKLIVAPDSKDGVEFDYCEVLIKDQFVEKIDEGDIALEVRVNPADFFKHKGDTYAIVRYENIKISVKPDNFDRLDVKNDLTIN